MYRIRLIFPDSSPGFTRLHHNIDMAAWHLLYHCIAFVFELKHWSHQLQEREDRTTVVKSWGFPPLHLSMYSMIQKGTHPQSQRIEERGESEDHFKKAVQAWMKLEITKSHPQWSGSASMPCSCSSQLFFPEGIWVSRRRPWQSLLLLCPRPEGQGPVRPTILMTPAGCRGCTQLWLSLAARLVTEWG